MRTVTGLIGKQNPDGYMLSTPNATIGIRGTEYDTVFVSPSASGQFRAEAGTYHRVFQGATQFKAGSKDQRVDEGQAIFAGLSNPDEAKKLTDIPAFLNLPANATQSTASIASSSNSTVANNSVPLVLSVRYGSPDQSSISSRGQSAPVKVYTVKLDSGKQVMMLGQSVFGDLPLQIGKDSVDSANYSIAIKASSTAGTDSAQLSFGEVQVSGKSGSSLTFKLSLDLSMGKWTEVSFKGPWQTAEKGRVAGNLTNSNSPVFVMLSTAR